MNELITVIIPIYNVEKYIRKCVDSVVNQTYSNLEIILVDDGSPDLSGKICDEYAKNDKRVKVIHKINGGLSDARNVGIDNATGKYLIFLDGDDSLCLDFCEYCLKGLTKYNADIYSVNLFKELETGEVLPVNIVKSIKVLDSNQAIKEMFNPKGLTWSAQAKLYKANLFFGVRYPLGMLMEDKATTYKLFDKSNRIVVDTTPKYYYLIRQGSIMHSKFSPKKLDTLIVQEELNDFIRKNYPDAINLTMAHTARVSIKLLCQICEAQYDDLELKEKLLHYLEENKKNLLISPTIDFRFKILGFCFCMLRKLYGMQIYDSFAYRYICKHVCKYFE